MKLTTIIFFLLTLNLVFGQSNPEINNSNSNIGLPNNSLELESISKEKANQVNKKSSSPIRADEAIELKDVNIENTFEYNYNTYLNTKVKDANAFSYLQKAYEIYPENVALYDDFMAYYEMNDQHLNRKEFSEKLYKSKTVENYLLEYNFNVLASLPQNAILFTNGYDDTYPVWINQDVKNVRKDVTIINVDLLQDKSYKSKVLKKAGLNYKSKYNGITLLENILVQNPSKNIYLGLTVNKQLIKKLYKNLYLVGVVLKYSDQPINNVAAIKKNWETNFSKRFINVEPQSLKHKKVLANYLIPLIQLHNHYAETNQKVKKEELKELILKIAKYNRKEKLVATKLKE